MKPWKIGVSSAVAFSRDGRLLATLGQDVLVWDVATRSKHIGAHPFSHPSSAAFSPDRQRLAVKSTSGHVVIIDAASGRSVVDFKNSADGEGSNLLYSYCGGYIVDGTWSGRLSVKNASSGALEFTHHFTGEMIQRVHTARDGGRWIVAHGCKATSDEEPPPPDYFSVWDWPFRRSAFRVLPRRIAFVRSSALSPDGALLAVVHGAPSEALSVFQVNDGACVGSVPVQCGGTGQQVGWSADGRLIGSVQHEAVVLYAWPSLQKCQELALAFPSDVAFSPVGDTLALGSWTAGWVLSASDPGTAALHL
jgi:hypothetical protein